MNKIADALPTHLGIPLYRSTFQNRNPLQIVRALFKPKTFIGFGKDFHFYTILSLASPTKENFVAMLDSSDIAEKVRYVPVGDFLELLMNEAALYVFEVEEVVRKQP